ncbi:hyalin-like [Antedon mediterranea]|uniref:hyalin-like n=1 Tax=Antedon mediterranea TaxID=105859 RepID=UPI003AF41D6D
MNHDCGHGEDASVICEGPDNEPPELQCPKKTSNYYRTYYGYIQAHTDEGSANGTISWVPLVARDNSRIPANITSYPHKSGDVYPMKLFPPYTTTIRATDQSGNFEECVLHFAVVDIESPVISCPWHSNNFIQRNSESSWSVFTDKSSRSARLYWTQPNATDNSGTVVSMSSNYNSGDVFLARNSAYEITYTAIDRDSNVGNCSFFITVEDLESPSIECPPSLESYTDVGSRFALLIWNITLDDNFAVTYCIANDSRVEPTNITFNDESITLTQYGLFPIGINEVEYIVMDISGNIDTCVFSITVIDNESPPFVCPSNFSNYHDYIFGFHRLVTDYGRPYATFIWYPPDVDDNSEGLVTWESYPYHSGDKIPIREFPPYTVQMTATDLFGNNRSSYVYFTVIDIERPNITCPSNITNYYDTYFGIVRAVTDPGSNTSSVTWEDPTVDDNSGGRLIVKSSYKSGDTFAPKFYPPYEVEFTAEDKAGNMNSCKLYFLITGKSSPN